MNAWATCVVKFKRLGKMTSQPAAGIECLVWGYQAYKDIWEPENWNITIKVRKGELQGH